jgi:hypothetical protein
MWAMTQEKQDDIFDVTMRTPLSREEWLSSSHSMRTDHNDDQSNGKNSPSVPLDSCLIPVRTILIIMWLTNVHIPSSLSNPRSTHSPFIPKRTQEEKDCCADPENCRCYRVLKYSFSMRLAYGGNIVHGGCWLMGDSMKVQWWKMHDAMLWVVGRVVRVCRSLLGARVNRQKEHEDSRETNLRHSLFCTISITKMESWAPRSLDVWLAGVLYEPRVVCQSFLSFPILSISWSTTKL